MRPLTEESLTCTCVAFVRLLASRLERLPLHPRSSGASVPLRSFVRRLCHAGHRARRCRTLARRCTRDVHGIVEAGQRAPSHAQAMSGPARRHWGSEVGRTSPRAPAALRTYISVVHRKCFSAGRRRKGVVLGQVFALANGYFAKHLLIESCFHYFSLYRSAQCKTGSEKNLGNAVNRIRVAFVCSITDIEIYCMLSHDPLRIGRSRYVRYNRSAKVVMELRVSRTKCLLALFICSD